MRLIDVYSGEGSRNLAVQVLFRLLGERQPHHNISHNKMPHYDRHLSFFHSKPYAAWYLIVVPHPLPGGEKIVGAVYLTRPAGTARSGDEIGIHIFKREQGHGYGPQAIKLLMDLHPRPAYYANINPKNGHSITMFERLGFKLKQVTYSMERVGDAVPK